MRRTSVRTGRNFSPARKVRSITAPSDARRSFVRTKAAPLPGLTCWNSSTLNTVPSTSMWLPFLSWFVEIIVFKPTHHSGGGRAMRAPAQAAAPAAGGGLSDQPAVLAPEPAGPGGPSPDATATAELPRPPAPPTGLRRHAPLLRRSSALSLALAAGAAILVLVTVALSIGQ